MSLGDIYGSNSQWLKADDLQGAKPVVTIQSAEIRENTYNGETKKQIVLSFVGKDKQLGLNFTNARKIAELTGTEDFNQWVGVSIKLYTEMTKLQNGQSVPAIRIFPELPTPSAQAPQEPVQQYSGPADDGRPIPF